jgi:hypothetical protein
MRSLSISLLTVVSTGHAATSLTGDACAGVLLKAGVGDTACTAGNRSVAVLAAEEKSTAGSVADAFSVDDASGGNGSEAENKGGDRELHCRLWKGVFGVVG